MTYSGISNFLETIYEIRDYKQNNLYHPILIKPEENFLKAFKRNSKIERLIK
jgi:hypothetical protein